MPSASSSSFSIGSPVAIEIILPFFFTRTSSAGRPLMWMPPWSLISSVLPGVLVNRAGEIVEKGTYGSTSISSGLPFSLASASCWA